MGSATDLAKTSADAVLLSNRLSSLVQALHMAQRTRRIIIENLAWASLYNGLVLPFRGHRLDHPNLGGTGHVRQLIVGGD